MNQRKFFQNGDGKVYSLDILKQENGRTKKWWYVHHGEMRYPISGEPSDKLTPFDWHK